eukprot:216032_1
MGNKHSKKKANIPKQTKLIYSIEEPPFDDNMDIIVLNTDLFNKIIHFWFRTCFKSKHKANISINIVINIAKKYYCNNYSFDNDILLKYFYDYENNRTTGYNMKITVIDGYNMNTLDMESHMDSKSCLWIIHSNGNVYCIKNYDIIGKQYFKEHQLETSESKWKCFINDTNLAKHKQLSRSQRMKLVSLLVNLQIGMIHDNGKSGGSYPCWHVSTTHKINHCGKQIAEQYGFEMKEYQNKNEIDFNSLFDFMQQVLPINIADFSELRHLHNDKHWKSWGNAGAKFSIYQQEKEYVLKCRRYIAYS